MNKLVQEEAGVDDKVIMAPVPRWASCNASQQNYI